jgi:hypothetical protein
MFCRCFLFLFFSSAEFGEAPRKISNCRSCSPSIILLVIIVVIKMDNGHHHHHRRPSPQFHWFPAIPLVSKKIVATDDSLSEFDEAFLTAFAAPKPTNAFPTLKCNPYKDPTCEQPGAGKNQVCGVVYSSDCEFYSIENFDDPTAAEVAGAAVLHTEGCGLCSTLQDVAVFMKTPDLRNEGETCTTKTLAKFNDGVQCFIDVGFTPPCADLWAKTTVATAAGCFGICFTSEATDSPSNGPWPSAGMQIG